MHPNRPTTRETGGVQTDKEAGGGLFSVQADTAASSTYINHNAKLHSEKYVLYAICIDTPRSFFTGELHIRIFRSRFALYLLREKVQPGRLTRTKMQSLGGQPPPTQRQPLGPSPGTGLRPYRFRHPGQTAVFHNRGCSHITPWHRNNAQGQLPPSTANTCYGGEGTSPPREVRRTVAAPFHEWYRLSGEDEPLRPEHAAAAPVRVHFPASLDVKTLHVRTASSKSWMLCSSFGNFTWGVGPRLLG